MKENTYTLGIIGGMGTLATAYFLEQLAKHTCVENDQEHINTIILNHASLPSRLDAIRIEPIKKIFLKEIKKDFKILQHNNVSFIALTCNTAYSFFSEFEKMTTIPIIHMPKETVLAAIRENPKIKKIGIIATDAALHSKVYDTEILAVNKKVVHVSPAYQKQVMSLIYDDIKAKNFLDVQKFKKIITHLKKAGAEKIILGCTELSLFDRKYTYMKDCVDSTHSLIKKCIELHNKKVL